MLRTLFRFRLALIGVLGLVGLPVTSTGCSDDETGSGGAGASTTSSSSSSSSNGGSGGADPTCGDGTCDAGETAESCPDDCATSECGDRVCSDDETYASCPDDCPCPPGECATCGNGRLEEGEECDGADVGDASCQAEGFSSGNVSCQRDCTLDTSACCHDLCAASGDTQCDLDVVQSCGPVAGGCLAWVNNTNCGTLGQVCDDTDGSAGCEKTCTDQCTAAGDTQCNGEVVETCTVGADTCLDWVPTTDCAATLESCDATGATAECVSTCTDQCAANGDTQCSGSAIQTCAQGAAGCLAWSTTYDCSASGQSCDDSGTSAVCVAACTDQCATAGEETCIGGAVSSCQLGGSGCLAWVATESCAAGYVCQASGGSASCDPDCTGDPCTNVGDTQCGSATTVEVCAIQPNTCIEWGLLSTCSPGEGCSDTATGAVCGVGEDCTSAYSLVGGVNTVDWTASSLDYLTTTPACVTTGDVTGPDVVLSYTATFNGAIEVSVAKPTNTRWVAVVSDAACGSVSPQLACVSDYTNASMGGIIPVTSGQTYWFYLADTTSGTLPLSDPLSVSVTEINCATFSATVTSQVPANGAVTTTPSPTLVATFDAPMQKTAGIITVTGNLGTNLSYDLSTSPSQVTFSNSDKTMTINPGIAFPAGELVTVSWSGLVDAICAKVAPPPAWSFTIVTPPCTPGTGGMVGSAVTKLPTGLASFTEYYVEVDTDPNGWVYFGGSSNLYRMPKAGGAVQNLTTVIPVSGTNLGYSMVVNGLDVFTVEAKGTGTTGHVWRLSTDGGATWNVQDYATMPKVPLDWLQSSAAYGGMIHAVTNEATSGTATEIYTMPATGSPPVPATLHLSVTGEQNCAGVAVDATNYYMACGTGERLVRVNRTTGAVTLITTAFDLSTFANAVHADDLDADGTADVLYFKSGLKQVWFVCNPAGPTPYADTLVNFGTGTTSQGLGFDRVNKRLYAYDDGPREIVVIQ